jgi:hypothetical protein
MYSAGVGKQAAYFSTDLLDSLGPTSGEGDETI